MRYTREVSDALENGRPVVALESTIIAHGLPRPENLEIARAIEDDRARGGRGAGDDRRHRGDGPDRARRDGARGDRRRDDVVKCSARDLSVVMARRATGATTVAATATLAVRAGIGVFATGGLGGVHREARDSWDESADLTTLGQTPITIVCAGVKSILDVEATLERLETLNVTLLGYRTDRFPGLLPRRLRLPGAVARGHAGGGRRRRARAGRARARRDRGRQPDRGRRSTPICTTACSPRGSRRPRARGSAART